MRRLLLDGRFQLWLVFILSSSVRFLSIGVNEIGHDEPFSIFYSQKETSFIFSELLQGNNPPLYELLLKLWTSIVGISAFGVRSFSAFISAMGVVFAFYYLKRLGSLKTAVIVVILLLFSSYQQHFGHEARVYAWIQFLTINSVGLTMLIVSNSKQKWYWLLMIVQVLMIYSHYLSWSMVILEWGALFFLGKWRSRKFWFMLTGVVIAFSPVLIILFNRIQSVSNGEGTWLTAPEFPELFNTLTKFLNAPVWAFSALVAVISYFFRKNKIMELIPVALFIAGYLGAFIISFVTPIFLDRYLIFFTFPLIITIAFVITKFKGVIGNGILVLLLLAYSIGFRVNSTMRINDKQLTDYLNSNKKPSDVLFFSPEWGHMNAVYHLDPSSFSLSIERYKVHLSESNIYYGYEFPKEIETEGSKRCFIAHYSNLHRDILQKNLDQLKDQFPIQKMILKTYSYELYELTNDR